MTAPAEVEIPDRITKLPVDRGFPVPWFVAWQDSKPDFRLVAPGAVKRALRSSLCWICGEPLGSWKVHVAGPMCAVNRTSSEPPSHRDCATYAAKACPFLARPASRRRENDLPGTDEQRKPPGVMIKRNPGVAMLWICRGPVLTKADLEGNWLIDLGEPQEVLWFREGRPATRAEVDESIASGLPILRAEAKRLAGAPMTERELAHIDRQVEAIERWLPAS